MLHLLLRRFTQYKEGGLNVKRSASTTPFRGLPHLLDPKVLLGASIFTVSYFAYIWVTDDGKVPALYPKTIDAMVYRRLPTNAFSYFVGLISEVNIPLPFRRVVLGTYAKLTGCNMEEARENDVTKYNNLSQLFQRKLKSECRPIDRIAPMISPVDGTVVYIGPVNEQLGLLNQVKGATYSLDEFFGSIDSLRSKKNDAGLYQCTIYLCPGDYHRFHTPTDWNIKIRRHFPGKLISVRPSFTNHLPGLFTINERVAYLGKWRHGFMSLTAVGATGVGSITVDSDPSLATNTPSTTSRTLGGLAPSFKDRHQTPCETTLGELTAKAGMPFGCFKLGSTIVLVFEAPVDKFSWNVKPGDKIQFGRPLLNYNQ